MLKAFNAKVIKFGNDERRQIKQRRDQTEYTMRKDPSFRKSLADIKKEILPGNKISNPDITIINKAENPAA